mgnify:CR=1 FL=1
MIMNTYDYCNSCGRLFDYLDLRPYKLKWYCKDCYKEILKSGSSYESFSLQSIMLKLYSYDYCSECGRLFDYLTLRPYDLKWYCDKCYEEKVLKVLEI